MKSDQTESANGRTAISSDGFNSRAAPELQAECRRQAIVIERLSEALSTFERGARALKAEDSELVTNSVRHSGVPEGKDVVVRVDLWRDGCRLEVEDPGRDGVIAPHPQDLLKGGGMGLHLVQMLSERWGVVRAAEGPTRVWAQLPRAAALA